MVVGGRVAESVEPAGSSTLLVAFDDPVSTGLLDVEVYDGAGVLVGRGAMIVDPPALPCGLTESEPNGLLSQAHFITPGITTCGSLDPAGDTDHYRFSAATGQNYTFETWAGRLGFPTDTILQLVDASGGVVMEDDDGAGNLDSRIEWTAPGSGQFFIRVLHFNELGGPGHDYKMTTAVGP